MGGRVAIGRRLGVWDWLDPVPPRRLGRFANLPLAGAGQGGKGLPLGNPGPWRMPTVGKAPGSGILSTGREPHAIHGVTLPFAVILTAHRLQSPHPAARQTAQAVVGKSQARAQPPSPLTLITKSYFDAELFDLTHKSSGKFSILCYRGSDKQSECRAWGSRRARAVAVLIACVIARNVEAHRTQEQSARSELQVGYAGPFPPIMQAS